MNSNSEAAKEGAGSNVFIYHACIHKKKMEILISEKKNGAVINRQ